MKRVHLTDSTSLSKYWQRAGFCPNPFPQTKRTNRGAFLWISVRYLPRLYIFGFYNPTSHIRVS